MSFKDKEKEGKSGSVRYLWNLLGFGLKTDQSGLRLYLSKKYNLA